MKMTYSYFITGTDTGIGKTLVSSALLHALAGKGLRVAGMKPVAAGATLVDGIWRNEDVDTLAAAATVELSPSLAVPYLLREAAAPHIAAALEQVTIDLKHIRRCYDQIAAQADAVVVEGVGGFRVPLTDNLDTADLAQLLGLPVIMTVGMRLGCLNHALLTADAIAARGLSLAGWVANGIDVAMPHAEANIGALRKRLPAPFIGAVPWQIMPSAAVTADHLDFSCLPGWPDVRTD